MERFGVHTYRLINAEGKATFVKFHCVLSASLPVQNLTGLSGGWYDFDVPFARDITVTTAAANLVTAVEEELGLKLKRSKGPVQVLVVERIERPTEN